MSNSYTDIRIDPSTGSESVTRISPEQGPLIKRSNCHRLDFAWCPEKGSPAYERNKVSMRPKIGQEYLRKKHWKDGGCHWLTHRRRKVKAVDVETFLGAKAWEQCSLCMKEVMERRATSKAKPKANRKDPVTGHYIDPVTWTEEEKAALAKWRKNDTDLPATKGDSGFKTAALESGMLTPYRLQS